jgi:8-oxo-dGTP diphosphatase
MRPGKYVYDYPRPAAAADVVLVTREAKARVLLVRRKHDPFAGCWALPGGFVGMEETLEAAARRELHEETGLTVGRLVQLHTFGDPGRDPRGRTISIVYLGLVTGKAPVPRAGDDAADAGWFSLQRLPGLAFDHKKVLACARKYLKTRRLHSSRTSS